MSADNNINSSWSKFKQLKKLRTALAVSQGTEFITTLRKEAEATVSQDQSKRVIYLTNLFIRIHREVYIHWQKQATVSHRPGEMREPNKRKNFRLAIEQLVLDDEANQQSAIFDQNGFVISSDDIAERLADFYFRMRTIRPFSYGNRITLDLFMTALGKLPAFKAVYEHTIDFRRLDSEDTVALHSKDDSETAREAVKVAFKKAMNPNCNKKLNNIANDYGIWPQNKVVIQGVPFLSHTTETGQLCLVLVNGGLVPYDAVKDNIFEEGKQFADIPLDTTPHVIGYLPETESLRHKDKHDIDGIKISPDLPVPLFCLDVNILTSLRSPSHADLMELLIQTEGEADDILFKLANNKPLKTKLLKSIKNDERLARSVEIAYSRLSKMVDKLNEAQASIFAEKSSVDQPQLFISMGGAGAGKSAVEEIAQAYCGHNFIIASLDEYRKISDLYTVLTAANHHSDDYIYVEPFAKQLRNMVANYACQNKFNILYDGTGIPYAPRYHNLVTHFQAAGFKTQITAIDAFLIKAPGREHELVRTAVFSSVKSRFKKSGRALPWVITVEKHIRAPIEFLKALNHPALEKISLFANDGEKDQHYLVAESFSMSETEIDHLHDHQRNGNLLNYMTNIIQSHDESALKKLADNHIQILGALIERNPAFQENNIAYQIYKRHDKLRVLLIYNCHRMVDFIEKRQLNPNASGQTGLLHKPENMSFDVDPLSENPGIKRLQGSSIA